MSLYEFEHAKRAELGIKYLCGVDEAGRGPLAGPVFAAAVILPKDCNILYLNELINIYDTRLNTLIEDATYRVGLSMNTLDKLNPIKLLQSGYSYVTKNNKVLDENVDVNDEIEIRTYQTKLKAKVINKEKIC